MRLDRQWLQPLILTLPLLCAGCATSRPPEPPVITQIKLERVTVPAQVLERCRPDPEIPDTVMGNREIADLFVDIWSAGQSCREVVDDVKEAMKDPAQ